jgi:thermostable 8-oxoguanine DNA glycosylase
MQIEIEDGIPVLVSRRECHRRIAKLRKKPGARPSKYLKDTMGKIDYNEQVAITIRQRKALKNWLSGEMTKKQAAQMEGFSSGEVINRTLEKLTKNESFIKEMDKQELTDEFIVEKIKEGCDAQHPLAEEGRKDYHAIDKFVDKYIKIKGLYAPTKIQQETESKHIHIHMTSEDVKARQEYERMRRESEVS